MRNDRENIIVIKSFEFSVRILEFCELLEEKRKFTIAKQLLRSGTSIGANIKEAQNAESIADFIHKLKIAAKEAEEAKYWLLLCEAARNYQNPEGLKEELEEIMKILSKIISTSKKKRH